MLFYFLSIDFNKDLFLEPSKETGRKECPPLVEFAELGKRGEEKRGWELWKDLEKEKVGGKEWTPAEFLFFAGSVPDFFTGAIAFASQTNTKKVRTFIPIIRDKMRLGELK